MATCVGDSIQSFSLGGLQIYAGLYKIIFVPLNAMDINSCNCTHFPQIYCGEQNEDSMTLIKSGYTFDIKGKTAGTVEEKDRWADAVYRCSTINHQTIGKKLIMSFTLKQNR